IGLWRAIAAVLLLAFALCAAPVDAAPKPKRNLALEACLLAHISVLASDEFDAREPGTDGEAKTLRYLGKQWFDLGLVSGTNDPGHPWFAPACLVAREPAGSAAVFNRKGRRVLVPQSAVLML